MRKLFFAALRLLTLNYYFQRKQKNSLLILMFHQINDKKNTFYPAMSVGAFSKLCQIIKSNYTVIHLSEIDAHFSKTNKPAAIISFDDGHYDILENAYPVLSALKMPFNINIDTEILETGKAQDFVRVYDILNCTNIDAYFNPKFMEKPIEINRGNPMQVEQAFTDLLSGLTIEEKREVTVDLAKKASAKESDFSKMLSKEDVQWLSKQDVEFGSHSHSHPILSNISAEEVQYELTHSKEVLENLTGKTINVLAYPNGIYNTEIEQQALEAGYQTLLQTKDQINHIIASEDATKSYTRVNQYHQSLDEALAHTYGIVNKLKKILR